MYPIVSMLKVIGQLRNNVEINFEKNTKDNWFSVVFFSRKKGIIIYKL